MADQVDDLEIDFRITAHPFLGYRKEDVIDLEVAYSSDILQGAFMGNVVLRLPGGDFSTPAANHGWRGLIEWCLRLDAAVQHLSRVEVEEHQLSEPDSNEYVMIRRDGSELIFSTSRAETVAKASAEAFLQQAAAFIRRSVLWVGEQYPTAKRNKKAAYIWERLDAYL